MRIKEIISENWWSDLDPGFLNMMGYNEEEQTDSEETNLVDTIGQEVQSIRKSHHHLPELSED